MKRAALTLFLITLAASVAGTPGAIATPSEGRGLPPTVDALRGAPQLEGVRLSPPRGSGNGRVTGGAPQPSGEVGTLVYSASATWCAPTPTRCQGWGGNARLAAVNSFRFGDEPYWVRLYYGENHADALVVSHCACFGSTGYIDVSPAVFRQLAPLSRGRIDVEVEVLAWPYEPGGDPPPHPSDDKMRLEDQPLPATDAVQ